MSKSIDIMVKNLKLFVRDRKVLLITLLVPIMFYTIMGVTFGSNTYSELNLSQYSLGFVNLDVNGEQAYNPYQSAEFIIDTISSNETEQDSSNLFSLEKNYTITDENGEVDANASVEAAEAAITAGNITTFITFDQGFQQRLNEKITILIGLYDNGTSDANPYIGNLTRGLIENQQPYVVVNLSQSNFMGIKEDMNETDFDYLVSVNNDLNLTLFYREGMLQENLDLFTYEFQTYCGTLLTHMDAHPAINITKRLLEGVQVQPNPSYSMHFLQSVDPTTKSIMTQTVNGIISSVINFDATEITMNSTTENVQGVVLNAITTGAPGYYLYGMLAILSFATTILAQESKEGLLRRLKSTRMKDSQLLMGNFLANTVILLIQFGVATGVMALFGLNPYFHDIGTLILGTYSI